jgi:16S rRNA processing protein RimM
MDEYINIGKVVATFGVGGEVILLHSLGKKLGFKAGDVLFIEQVQGSYLPYFIASSKAKTMEESYVLLEGINSKESANRLISKQAWLLDADFRKHAGKDSPISLLGYKLFNEEEFIGKIEEVIEQPHQVLLKITYNGNEALIPLHEETLDKIDRMKGEVFVTLPDGLLEIYG